MLRIPHFSPRSFCPSSRIRSQFPHAPDEEDLLVVAEEETDKLNSIVNESVDMARVEPGRTRIRKHPLDCLGLHPIGFESYESVLDGRLVEIQVPDRIPRLNADPELASLALRQLIGNAVKYSPPSSKIGISVEELDSMMIALRVFDEGPGIPPNEVNAIFERFYRGESRWQIYTGDGNGVEHSQRYRKRAWRESEGREQAGWRRAILTRFARSS